jgi:hypothetical protein
MKQTAVEWLEEKLDNALSDTDYLTWKLVCEAIKQAKEMEKQQIVNAHLLGLIYPLEIEASKQAEQYYNETFKKE